MPETPRLVDVIPRSRRRRGRSPRKVLQAIRSMHADALVEQLGNVRNARRQARHDAKEAQW